MNLPNDPPTCPGHFGFTRWLRREGAHPTTTTHDRTITVDVLDALYSVFGDDGVDPNAPHIKPEQRRALRRALVDRGVDPTTVLVPRFVGPRVPAINTFELRDNHTAYDDPDSEVA